MDVREPSDIRGDEITDANAGNYAVVVYKKASDAAGLKTLNLAEWKQFMNYNGYKVDNIGTLLGFGQGDWTYDVDHLINPPATTLLAAVQGICSQTGATFAPPTTPGTTMLARINSLDVTVNGNGSTTGLVTDVAENTSQISALQTIVGTPGSTADTLCDRMSSAENNISTLTSLVSDNTTGLVPRMTAVETTVGDSNSGLVKNTNDLLGWVKNGWTNGSTPVDGLLTRTNAAESDITHLKSDVSALQSVIGTGGGSTEGLQSTVLNLVTFTGMPTSLPDYNLNNRMSTLWDDVENSETGLKYVVGSGNAGLVGNMTNVKAAIGGDDGFTFFSGANNIYSRVKYLTDTLGKGTMPDSQTLIGSINTLWADVEGTTGLKGVVGNSTTGLVKDVNELWGKVGRNNITANKTITEIIGSSQLYNDQSLTQNVLELGNAVLKANVGIKDMFGTGTLADNKTVLSLLGSDSIDVGKTITGLIGNTSLPISQPTITGSINQLWTDVETGNIPSRVSTLESKLGSVYSFQGSITQSTVINWSSTKHPESGYVYNVESDLTWWGSTDHNQSQKTFYKGENVAFVIGDDWNTAYLDSLGISFDVSKLEQDIDSINTKIGNSSIGSGNTITGLLGDKGLAASTTITGLLGTTALPTQDGYSTVTKSISTLKTGYDDLSNTVTGEGGLVTTVEKLSDRFKNSNTTALGITTAGVYMITAYKTTGEIGVLHAYVKADGTIDSNKYTFTGSGTSDTASTYFENLTGLDALCLKSGYQATITKLS